jgi:hypothetical protein
MRIAATVRHKITGKIGHIFHFYENGETEIDAKKTYLSRFQGSGTSYSLQPTRGFNLELIESSDEEISKRIKSALERLKKPKTL